MSHSFLTKLVWFTGGIGYAVEHSFVSFGQSVREYFWMKALETEKRNQKLKFQYPKEWKKYNKKRMTAVANRVKPLPEECMDFSYYLFLLKTQ